MQTCSLASFISFMSQTLKKEKFSFIYQLYAKKFDTSGMPFFPKRDRLEIDRDHGKWFFNPPRELSSSLTDTRYKKENYGERCLLAED